MLPKSKSIKQAATSPSFSHADPVTIPFKALVPVPKIVFITPSLDTTNRNFDVKEDTFTINNDSSPNKISRRRDRKRRR